MKVIIFFILFSLISNVTFSQNDIIEVNYKKIKKEIEDVNSNYYYDSLFSRYSRNDTTLNELDYHYLYFGYTFNSNYNPYGRTDWSEKAVKLRSKGEMNDSDLDKLIQISSNILEEFPFDLDGLLYMVVAYDKKGDVENYNKWYRKYDGIISTILLSGDGLSEKTAIHVITTSDEYIILSILGFKFDGEQALVGKHFDRLKVSENEYNIEYLYFNVERLFASWGLK